MATTRSKIVAELIGTAGTIDTAKLTDNAVTVAKLATALNLSSNTITLPLGVGGTDWSSSVQTDNFNAEANKGYYVNSTNKIITVTLPSNPTVGQIISIVDVSGTADTNPILLNPNGKQINGVAAELELATERSGVQIAYSGHDTGEFGWVVTDSANDYTVSDKTSTSTGILVVATPIITELRNLASQISPGGKPYFQAAGNTIEIIGRNFKSDATVVFRGIDNSTYSPATFSVDSSTKITTSIPGGMIPTSTPADGFDPFDVTVTNGSTGVNKFFRLDDSLEWLPTPAFQVPAGSLGELFRTENMTQLKNIQATGGNFTQFNARTQKVDATSLDTGDVITHTISSGSLPTGVSIATDGTLSGTVTAPLSGKTTSTFTVQASVASEISGDTETIEQTREYSITSIGTRVSSVDITTFDGSSGTTFTVTGHGFVDNNTITQADQGVKLVSGGFTQYVNNINVVNDNTLTFTTSANILATDITGSGLDIVVKLVGSTDEFKLSDESSSLITAPAGITAGTPTTLTNTITTALRGQPLTGTDFVIPAATDANGGSIASYALNTAFSASTGLSSDANWLSFNPSNRQITGNVPSSFITGGGSITVPIRITDNVGNTLNRDYTITVDAQGFSYPLGISHSAMFDGSSYLSRGFTGGDKLVHTVSFWVKRSVLGTDSVVFSAGGSANTNHIYKIGFGTNDSLQTWGYSPDAFSVIYSRESNALFRDTSSWYHFVQVVDYSGNQSGNDRVKLYVNGTQVTSFSTAPTTNNADSSSSVSAIGNSYTYMIGRYAYGSQPYFSGGYMANIDFIDGQALGPEYFGKTQDGIWVAKAYDGTTNELGNATDVEYGANGFKLTFADSGDLGKDTAPTSGSNVSNHTAANNWTNN